MLQPPSRTDNQRYWEVRRQKAAHLLDVVVHISIFHPRSELLRRFTVVHRQNTIIDEDSTKERCLSSARSQAATMKARIREGKDGRRHAAANQRSILFRIDNLMVFA
jgi:hypothetical protein